MNTHAPAPFAGEGIYDWLKHREPRWASLAIIHRLDKDTSGLIVFGKSRLANQSLTAQFAGREVQKKYQFLTDRSAARREWTVKSKIIRAGERYISSPHGQSAETRFRRIDMSSADSKFTLIEAEPLTGRTHQIRVHAAESNFPILGDTLYGGSAFERLCLHATELSFKHPATGEELHFHVPAEFKEDIRQQLRRAMIEPQETNAYRVINGASDGWPGWYVDRLGDHVLSQFEREPAEAQLRFLQTFSPVTAGYHKTLSRQVSRTTPTESSPRLLFGQPASESFVVHENGILYELSFAEGYSVGLFLDQRDNRRRLLTGHIAAGFPLASDSSESGKREFLNLFAYTCGFSVCAARGGYTTVSVDLSKKYLEWGRRNFALNGIDPVAHEFVYGDAFEWLQRFRKKDRRFEIVILDPPTFSRSKQTGPFRAEKDYGRLVSAALRVLKTGGVLLASSNAARWPAEEFVPVVETAVREAGRRIVEMHYAPQPPDFPVSQLEPAYLKTLWLKID